MCAWVDCVENSARAWDTRWRPNHISKRVKSFVINEIKIIQKCKYVGFCPCLCCGHDGVLSNIYSVTNAVYEGIVIIVDL